MSEESDYVPLTPENATDLLQKFVENDPNIQESLQKKEEGLHEKVLNDINQNGFSLDTMVEGDERLTWKAAISLFLKNNLSSLVPKEGSKLSEQKHKSFTNLLNQFYDVNNETESFVKSHHQELKQLTSTFADLLEKNYSDLLQKQIESQMYPGCNKSTLSLMFDNEEKGLMFMMMSIIFIETELVKQETSSISDESWNIFGWCTIC